MPLAALTLIFLVVAEGAGAFADDARQSGIR
jgi:hypothetical protein